MSDLVIVHDPAYARWVFNDTHPTQGRRFINGYNLIVAAAGEAGVSIKTCQPSPVNRDDLLSVHDALYVSSVLDNHRCGEWSGSRPDMSNLAGLFVGGTMTGVGLLEEGRTVVHLPGAKHHAQRDHSSGFCVFADFAIAARKLSSEGKRVAILDVDGHHGDGTENLTLDDPNVLTFSIHEWGIFPCTGERDNPEKGAYNHRLSFMDGDDALVKGVWRFLTVADEFDPDVVMIAGGADGHRMDPLTNLAYSIDGLEAVMYLVRWSFPDKPILFGGAGGYRPDDWTPMSWARMVTALSGVYSDEYGVDLFG